MTKQELLELIASVSTEAVQKALQELKETKGVEKTPKVSNKITFIKYKVSGASPKTFKKTWDELKTMFIESAIRYGMDESVAQRKASTFIKEVKNGKAAQYDQWSTVAIHKETTTEKTKRA